MTPRQYNKHPEFAGLETYVWDYLNSGGQSIPVIAKRYGRSYVGSKDNQSIKNHAVWHNKVDLDIYVSDRLNLNPDDYGKDKSKNPFYKATANVIRELRLKGTLIDWDRTDTNRGIGIWKLDKQKLETFVSKKARKEMKEKNFFACGEVCMIHTRAKQNLFRQTLMDQYEHCQFCGFKLERYLIGAHIVPYSEMRMSEPENAMNPSNGLLLCRLCDVAFERYDILLKKDYRLEISDDLQDSHDRMIRKWVESIPPQITIGDVPYKPDGRYLEWKMRLRAR